MLHIADYALVKRHDADVSESVQITQFRYGRFGRNFTDGYVVPR